MAQVMQVVEFQHVKPGKGAAFVRTKMKNVITGVIYRDPLNPTANRTVREKKDMEYSYNGTATRTTMNQEILRHDPHR